MTIKVGDRLPDGQLSESTGVDGETGCSLGPAIHNVADLVKGKKIAIFGLPGAYTPTCSAKHVPGYVRHYDALRARGIDEIWCLSVNDAFVMNAWGRDQKVGNKIRIYELVGDVELVLHLHLPDVVVDLVQHVVSLDR